MYLSGLLAEPFHPAISRAFFALVNAWHSFGARAASTTWPALINCNSLQRWRRDDRMRQAPSEALMTPPPFPGSTNCVVRGRVAGG
jgi:hypothetical protein